MIEFVKSNDNRRCRWCYYRHKMCGNKPCTGENRGYYVQVPNESKPAKVKDVAEVTICHSLGAYWFRTTVKGCEIEQQGYVSRRSSAVAKARKFCRAIGYECEIK